MPTEPKSAFFLVGPTAVGKTAVAHILAARHGYSVLSTDAMLVYRGMDIGTAKPTVKERKTYGYTGTDLVNPSQEFNVAAYLEAVKHKLHRLRSRTPLLAAGGSGLYVSGLIYGLDAGPGSDAGLRAKLEKQLERGGVEVLQETLQAINPEWLAQLPDPRNPRRLIRAIEKASSGQAPGRSWKQAAPALLTGLSMPREHLAARIRERVDRMYDDGLLEEVARLLEQYPAWSPTASKAIGYAEARAVRANQMSEKEARERTAARTRQLAKRQMTWFRNQFEVEWIEAAPGDRPEELADRVQRSWDRIGPVHLLV